MPIIPLICPCCGANLQVNSDEPILVCNYCGRSSVMKDAIVQNYIQNSINITAGTVNVVNQKDFVIEGGVLKKYQGESIDIVIPNTVVSIVGAFNSLRIRSVEIPNSVEEIGEKAFFNCSSLSSITIPDSVKCIGEEAFSGCTSLASISIPNSVEYIDSEAFSECTSLTSIIIPESVKLVGFECFFGCSSLETIQVMNHSTKIGWDAYRYTKYSWNLKQKRDQEQAQKQEIANQRKKQGLCQHCGGQFKGFLLPTCTQCGKHKDYND